MVRIEGLGFTYRGRPEKALRDVDLHVSRGELVTITGPSGCGKSTLGLCLAGFIPQGIAGEMEGSVWIDGLNTRETPVYLLSRKIGLVQQDPESQLCTSTVEDEVAFGPENHCLLRSQVAAAVVRALDAVGAAALRHREINALSGGEKQKVAIASMLALQPPVIVLDEPTSGLDPAATAALIDLLQKLRAEYGLTVIVIEHYLAPFVDISSRLVLMRDGAVIYNGPPAGAPEYFSSKPLHPVNRPPGAAELIGIKELTLKLNSCEVLRGISMTACKGEIVGLMGSNGAGKSTLLQCILGLVKPSGGKILLNRRDISREPVFSRARHLGYVFQNPNHQIFTGSVAEEVQMAPRNFGITGESCEAVADRVLHSFALHSHAGDHPLSLSYGQKRRLNIASVSCHEPAVMLLDEPLVGQDFLNVERIMDAVLDFSANGGVVMMVCHNPEVVAAYCHRVVFMEEGRIMLDLPVPDIFEALRGTGKECFTPGAAAGYESRN